MQSLRPYGLDRFTCYAALLLFGNTVAVEDGDNETATAHLVECEENVVAPGELGGEFYRPRQSFIFSHTRALERDHEFWVHRRYRRSFGASHVMTGLWIGVQKGL